eukprot:1178348-Prorocentrum_minimum.AAC.3
MEGLGNALVNRKLRERILATPGTPSAQVVIIGLVVIRLVGFVIVAGARVIEQGLGGWGQ